MGAAPLDMIGERHGTRELKRKTSIARMKWRNNLTTTKEEEDNLCTGRGEDSARCRRNDRHQWILVNIWTGTETAGERIQSPDRAG